MKNSFITSAIVILISSMVFAGKPIILSEAEACSGADLVAIVDIERAKDIPDAGPFRYSKWHDLGFSEFANAKVINVLIGTAPKKLLIYGGQIGSGTFYRLEKGKFLLLLKKVERDAYRAVDIHYSFMRIEGDKVGWLEQPPSKKTEWINIEEAVRRIKTHHRQVKQVPGSSRGNQND